MNEDTIYTPAVSTNVLATFRRLGWTPPSEDEKIVAKWEYYQTLALRKHADVVTPLSSAFA
jgi:hypothetical protein